MPQSAGNQVVEFMQKLCSNDVNMPVGGVVHSGMQNDRGGYENDCLLIRRSDNRWDILLEYVYRNFFFFRSTTQENWSSLHAWHKLFYSYLMLAPTTQQTRIMDYMRRQITPEACVSVADVTSKYSVLSVVGPKSREMLSLICNTDLIFYENMAKVNTYLISFDTFIFNCCAWFIVPQYRLLWHHKGMVPSFVYFHACPLMCNEYHTSLTYIITTTHFLH